MTSTFGSAYAISISTTVERTTNTAKEEFLEWSNLGLSILTRG
jgi:hypothetical protein